MDKRITKEELTAAREASTINAAPGIDGLPIEWYSTFWDEVQPIMTTFSNDIFENGLEEGAQQRLSLIRLIHKKGDREDLDNYRPISLLCVDYKLVSKVLSLRLKIALPHIIEEDQTCGILGRTIFQNLYTIRDTIAYTNDHKIPTYILSFDYQKAFDKVDHSFLNKALKAFNFGSKYTSFVQATNGNCFARVMNSGRFTKDIQLQRSVKQGDQESMQFFDIIAEVVAIQIRKNENIKGLRLPGKATQLKLSLYADDNNSIVTTQQSIVHLYRELKRFEMASGCNINESKTEGLLVGGALRPVLPYQINWNPAHGMKVLGVQFFTDYKTTQTYTWKQLVKRMQVRAEKLSSRDLSMTGRATLANSLLLSKAWHVATVIPPTKATIQKINTIVFKYIYNYKEPHTIAHKELTLRVHQGGINVLDLELQQKALRISKLKHILDPTNDASWLVIPRLYTASTIIRYNTDWPFLASPDIPRIDFQDPNNTHLNIPEYLYDIIKMLKDNKQAFLSLKNPTTRGIYDILLKQKLSTLRITGQNYWNTALGYELPWKNIWKTTYQSLETSKHLDTYFKFLHNSLASGQRLTHYKRTYNINCARCYILETPLHMFATCPFARETWNKYHYIYAHFLKQHQVHYQAVLFSQQLPEDKHERKLLLTLTNIIVHELWRARCVHKFQNNPTNTETSTYNINARIKHIHYAYQRHSSNHIKQLCIPNPMCSINARNHFKFNLPDAPIPAEPPDDDIYSSSSESSSIST